MPLSAILATPDPLAACLPAFVLLVILALLLRTFGHRYRGSKLEGLVRAAWLWASVAALAFIGTVSLGRLSKTASVDLEADMQVSDGRIVEAYINDVTADPARLNVVRDRRWTYRFVGIPPTLTFLRLDPTEAPGARISIYSVAIISEGRVVRRFGPAELRSWSRSNVSEPPGDPAALNLVSTNNDPILSTAISLDASQRPAWLLYFLDVVRRPHFYSLMFVACFLLFLLCGVSRAQGAVEAGLVAAVAALAYPLANLAARIPVSPPPVSSAVGYASYAGYPKFDDHLISFALLALCIGLAWLASRYSALPPPLLAREKNEAKERLPVWLSRLVSLAVFVWLLIVYLPDLRGELQQISQISFQPADWDSANSLLWSYFVHQGYLPFRDFWYPYAGFYAHLLAFPVGTAISCIEGVLTLWFLYLGLRQGVTRRCGAAVLIFAMVLVPAWLDEFAGWCRYLLAIDVALCYVALQETRRIEWRKHVPFALLTGFVFFYEPTQLLYAGFGMLAHSLFAAWPKLSRTLDLKAARSQAFTVVRQRAVYIVSPMLAGILPVLAFLTAKGMLPGFVRFHLSLSDVSVYSAVPADVAGWTVPTLRFETVFMVLFFVLTLALYAWFRDGRRLDLATVALLVIGFAGFLAMQKQIARPHNMHVIQIYPYLGILLYGLAVWSRRTRAQGLAIAVFVGFVAGTADYRGELGSFYRSLRQAPTMLAADCDFLLRPHPEVQRANADEYDPARFASSGPENAVVQVLRNEFGFSQRQLVYVLGDDSVFYILLRQEAPYLTNNYNCSPLTEQQHVLEWLRERRPRFVLWKPSAGSFDGVPHVVRLPLIYQFVVENYRYVRTVGPYHILMTVTERPGTDPLYWIQQLGSNLDLGNIPRLTKASGYRNCPATGSTPCADVLFVRFSGAASKRKVLATIDSHSGQFQVQFDVVPSAREYIIDLDRLWFRSLIGPHPHVTVPIFGLGIRQESRLRKNGILY